MWIINHRKIFFIFSILLVCISIGLMSVFGFNLGIDFKGGTIIEVKYLDQRPETNLLRNELSNSSFGVVQVQPTDDNAVIFRLQEITDAQKVQFLSEASLADEYQLEEIRSNTIGPTIGKELSQKGLISIALVSILIIIFIAFVFRHVSQPVSSWKYGLIAVIALAHDIIIVLGITTLLSFFRGLEIDSLFITALLIILGLSVNDTIVVFDRIRENLKNKVEPHFDNLAGLSLNQTITRSINTSVTVIFVLLALFFLGGPTTRDFALILTIGMIVGTYSSIFLAAPLLVSWQKKIVK